MDGYCITTEYPENKFYAEVTNESERVIAEIHSSDNGEIVGNYEISYISRNVMTRAGITDVLRFTHQTDVKVPFLDIRVCGIVHEVYLEVYQNGSFRQINNCQTHSVIYPDGISGYEIQSPVSLVNPSGGKYPTTKVGCNYAGTCAFLADTSLEASFEAAGFTVGGSVGGKLQYTKRLSGSWDISVM